MTVDEVNQEYSKLLNRIEGAQRQYQSFPEPDAIAQDEEESYSTKTKDRLATLTGRVRFCVERCSNAFRSKKSCHGQDSSTAFACGDPVYIRQKTHHVGLASKHLVAVQKWSLIALVGGLIALMAYIIDVSESVIFDYKYGFCKSGWYLSKRRCCSGFGDCVSWWNWSEALTRDGQINSFVDFPVYFLLVIFLASLSCLLALRTEAPMLLADASALVVCYEHDGSEVLSRKKHYTAAGSGVAEMKLIISGFRAEGYLGAKTLLVKSFALILSAASGLSLGKEGPYIHLATCISDIVPGLFGYDDRDGKKWMLRAGAASGLAVAFGAPVSGVVFVLEDFGHGLPPRQLFLVFFCCIASTLSLKILNPYGTHKTVLFEVNYTADWKYFETVVFILLGIAGGTVGALFVKTSRLWEKSFRRVPIIRQTPLLETALVGLLTGLLSFWNRYTRSGAAKLLSELATPCDRWAQMFSQSEACPPIENIPDELRSLAVAIVIKGVLTVVTFGLHVPAGIYVPSMVVGGLFGKLIGHTTQLVIYTFPHFSLFTECQSRNGVGCITPGIYAMVGAGVTMCGVTRLPVTLAVILFELTGSLEYMIPFSIAIFVSKWVADAIEQSNIYDLVNEIKSYPPLGSDIGQSLTGIIGDLLSAPYHEGEVIDVTSSAAVPATHLQRHLDIFQSSCTFNIDIPLLSHGTVVGHILAASLRTALNKLEDPTHTKCLLLPYPSNYTQQPSSRDDYTVDFTSYVDSSSVVFEATAKQAFVYECFRKLQMESAFVSQEGTYIGTVTRRGFMQYVQRLHQAR